MRSTVIPAQITTVEDKIMGNLNLTQIMLLMAPVFWGTIVYSFFLPQMRFAWYKLPLIFVVVLFCLILAIRVKGKLVMQWLKIVLRFNMRPKYFVFNKNDGYLRTIEQPNIERKQVRVPQKSKTKTKPIMGWVSLETILSDPRYSFSIKSGKKGGLHVALEQIT